jgi:3-hydroxyisobutyrate dehydrogenase-like beta-hydroxyacid dehydrogenase
MKLGFVGLGGMGTGMAMSLLGAGHELTVWNRSPGRAEALRAKGAHVARTPREASTGAEVVVTMLADDAAVEGVVFGDDGILAGLGRGAVHMSSSTISVALSARLAAAHASAAEGYVAAPVMGRPDAAAARQLWVLVAGPSADVERCRPVIEGVGRGMSRLGEVPTAANVVKLATNFLIASMIEALGEAFALTRKAGIEPSAFVDVYSSTFAKSPIFERYAQAIAREDDDSPGFKARLALKDLRLVLAAGEAAEVPMPLASLVHDHLLSVVARGLGDLDWAVIARLAAERAGLKAKQ